MIISNKYKLIKKVGSGAFGEIYKGKSSFEKQKLVNSNSKFNKFLFLYVFIFLTFF